MAYFVRLDEKNTDTLELVKKEITTNLNISRFRCDISTVLAKFYQIEFRQVRLLINKPYCGNHGGPCLGFGGHKKRKLAFLEGADWVAFNDMINDSLDTLEISALVKSSHCLIRKGLMRCTEYYCDSTGEWKYEGVYENAIGHKIKAGYPDGTPGIDTWRADTPDIIVVPKGWDKIEAA